MTGAPTVTIPAWVARATQPLVDAELARVRVMARSDARWAPEVLRLETALRELQTALSKGPR
jgi:hypothetical protein